MKNDAGIAICKCKKVDKLYGIRFEKIDGQWIYNWAFALKESTARNEGYDHTVIKGSITPSEDYPGCPYCGSKVFVICGCGKLTCLDSENGYFMCPWCRSTYKLGIYDGSGFSSQMDR